MGANLPAGLEREASDRHAMDCATRPRGHARLIELALARAVATTSELDDQALAHELGAI